MDELEMIHDFVAAAPKPPARSKHAARAALQAQMTAETTKRTRKRTLHWKRLLPTTCIVAILTSLSVFVINPLLHGGQQQTAAAAVLRAASHTAARQPAHVLRPGEYAYTKSEGFYWNGTANEGKVWGATVRTVREAWIGLDGSGRIREKSEPPVLADAAARACWRAAGSPPLSLLTATRTSDQHFGPRGLAAPLNVDGFKREELMRMAGDPGALAAAIRDKAERTDNPVAYEMLTIVGDILRESVAPPELRATLYKVAADIPGVELIGKTQDALGRPGLAVAASRHDLRLELIFDPSTSAVLADQETATAHAQCLDAGGIFSSTVYLDSGITSSVRSS